MPVTAIVADPVVQQHITPSGHPERPTRFSAIIDFFNENGLMQSLQHLPSRQATDRELRLCHTADYINLVKREIQEKRSQLSTGDADISPTSLEPALHAAGGVLNSVDAVLSKKVRNAFCVIRPPGHHANANRGMGFCLFNNLAIGARYAQRKHGAGRVLIADWDVHHGNGTQDIFYEDASVFFFSTHQSPWYPGTGARSENGAGRGEGTTLNCPFPAGSGRTEILGAFREQLIPAARKFRPDLVMISAGFDSRTLDPLGNFTLTDDDFADLTKVMQEIADEFAEGRIVSVLEGGYNLQGLASAAAAHVRTLAGNDH